MDIFDSNSTNNNFSAAPGPPPNPRPPATTQDVVQIMRTVSLVIFCLVFILGSAGNGLVLYVTGCRMKRTVNAVWFFNLALADLLFTVFLLFTIVSLAHDRAWPFGGVLCKLCGLVNVVTMFASVFLLAAISLDRCLSVCAAVWVQNRRTPRKAQAACGVLWLAALACGVPYAVAREAVPYPGATYCTYAPSKVGWHWSLTAFRLAAGFAAPFLLITASYVAIGVRASQMQRGRKRRSLRIIVSVVLAFFLCWLPFHVLQFVEMDVRKRATAGMVRLLHIAVPLSVNLAYLNSCLNPVLYVFMCEEFQKKLRLSLCHVLESALADDLHSYTSTRSHSSTRTLSLQLSKISRKSDSTERKGSAASPLTPPPTYNEVFMEDTERLDIEKPRQ